MGLRSLFGKQGSLLVAHSLVYSLATSRSTSLNSHAQIEEELKLVFKKFDVNDDRKISSIELGSILGSLGYTATVEEHEMMIREVDADSDECTSLDEFIVLNMKDIDSDEILENLKEAFSRSSPMK
ncbi:hypothetical protein U1Q18_027110 [Sarracenia purpurea var. burkii]